MNDQTSDNTAPFLTFAEKSDLHEPHEPRLVINLERFIENGTGLVAYAMTRSGKSHRLRGVCEETFGRVQHVIVDSEGEFSTLRPRFDYLLAAAGETPGDVPLTRDNAADLCRIVMEKGVSVILDISDANEEARGDIAAAFLIQLLETPREHRRPCFVVVDEVHRFAPEGGVKSASARALAEICARGAKRGLIPIFATQNIAKTSKRAVEELPNKLVGRLTLDTHVDRAIDDLGLRRTDAQALKNLPRGHFYAVGPSLCDLVTEVRTGPNLTAPPPRFAKGSMEPPPASEAIQALIVALSELPQMDTMDTPDTLDVPNLETARAKIADLTRRLQNTPAPKIERVIEQVEVPVMNEAMEKRIEMLVADMMGVGKDLVGVGGELLGVLRKVRPEAVPPVSPAPQKTETPRSATAPANPTQAATASVLPVTQQKYLDALSAMDTLGVRAVTRAQLAATQQYTAGTAAFERDLGTLRKQGLIDCPSASEVVLTVKGKAEAQGYATPQTTGEALTLWKSILSEGLAEILDVLFASHPRYLDRDTIARRVGVPAKSKGLSNNLGLLKVAGLVEYPLPSKVRATELVFGKGGR